MRNVLVLCCALASSACLRTTEYRCQGDSSCGGAGMCETSGFCSFPDGECASGRRYNEAAGTLGGTCTSGGNPQDDANNPVDDTMQVTDTNMTDTPAAQCPNGYVTIAGGNAGHLYKLIPGNATWPAQEAACQLTTIKSHLAVPDDIGELTALDTVAGSGRYWIGVTDSAAEGTWYSILGVAQTYLPWEAGAPATTGPEEDCVESANSATHEFNDERCTNTSQPAICECAP